MLAQLNKLETGIQSVHARLEVWIRTFNARMDSLDHDRLNVIDSGLDAVEAPDNPRDDPSSSHGGHHMRLAKLDSA